MPHQSAAAMETAFHFCAIRNEIVQIWSLAAAATTKTVLTRGNRLKLRS
jgi:hypothetical protein